MMELSFIQHRARPRSQGAANSLLAEEWGNEKRRSAATAHAI
jgi:hypothetical protein